jgi:hypothetical protein
MAHPFSEGREFGEARDDDRRRHNCLRTFNELRELEKEKTAMAFATSRTCALRRFQDCLYLTTQSRLEMAQTKQTLRRPVRFTVSGECSIAGASGQSSDKMPAFAFDAASFGADFVVQESA